MEWHGLKTKPDTLEVSHTQSLLGEEVQLYSQPLNLEILEARAAREGERAMR